jgi:hypothetical protein
MRNNFQIQESKIASVSATPQTRACERKPGGFSIRRMKQISAVRSLSLMLALVIIPAHAAEKEKPKAWIDPEVAKAEDPQFLLQGEYLGGEGDAKYGAQVVAQGGGRFDVYILEGGLPGAGWEPGKARNHIRGVSANGIMSLRDKTGIAPFFVGMDGDKLTIKTADGKEHILNRTERESPTLGAKPPEGAVVLFDGTSAEKWENGKVENGHLLATGATSKEVFADFHLHLEFRTPYMPDARGQGRGNSGIYHSGRWETQVLDSFGLDGKDNETGGIYSISKPRLNMCLPPLTWQTYDVDFTAAKFDAEGKRTAWPRITVKLNGVLVHEDLELNKDFTTSAPITTPLETPFGPVFLQNHSNPVAFRNIWIVPGK